MDGLVFAGTSPALWLMADRDPHNAWPIGLIAVFFGIGLVFHYLLTRPAAR